MARFGAGIGRAQDRSVPRPLNEQVVVVTGASQGIGRETALRLGRRGAAVVAAARNEEALTTLVEEIAGFGGPSSASGGSIPGSTTRE